LERSRSRGSSIPTSLRSPGAGTVTGIESLTLDDVERPSSGQLHDREPPDRNRRRSAGGFADRVVEDFRKSLPSRKHRRRRS
jgi:hypothetical protein